MENLNIEEFNPKKAELVALAESCKDLEIKGIDDIDGYGIVNAKRKELKMARVEITKTGKKLRESAIAFQKQVIEKEREFVAIIEPLEIELADKQKAIDIEKEKAERLDLLPKRKELLLKINVEVEDDELLLMGDLEFHTFLNDKRTEFFEEKERLLEEERLKAEEEKRKEAEEKAEQERQAELKKQEEEKEKKRQKEMEEARIKAEKDAQERAEKEKQEAIAKAEQEKLDAINKEKEESLKREKAIRDEHEAEEKARIQREVEARIAQEKKESQEKAEQERIDKDKKWKAFLAKSGWTKETESEFYILQNGNTRTIYKKVGEITI